MMMVITLRNGVQVRASVKDMSTRVNSLNGDLRGLEWTYDDDPAGTSIGWVDISEIAAVHAERDTSRAGVADSLGKPVSA